YKVNKSMPQVLFCAVERGDEDIIPRGDFVIRPGDRVHVMGEVTSLTNFFKFIGKDTSKMRSVMVMGGSRIAYYLARMLLEMNIAVTILEVDEEKARYLSEMLPKATIIHGDGTDQDLLTSEGLNQYDAFVTLSGRDEDNLMSGLYAAQQGVKKVIVKNDRDNYASLIAKFGLSSIVSPLTITCNTILRTVRGRSGRKADSVQRMYKLMDGKYEALEFIADRKDPFIGVPLKDLTVAPDCLIGVIVRDSTVLIPFGNDTIEAGDSVVVISKSEGLYSLGQVLSKRG
ncbi:MAG: Trk system potassium transporter TrkA, partial [Clostridiales bacterium]|nr:Trk system potassium transporter TrkA [Clostridiales bacterium]